MLSCCRCCCWCTGKKIKAVCIVHNETTTGVTSDIGGCRKAMDNASHPALLLVDGACKRDAN